MSRRAQRSSTSGPTEAPTKRLNLFWDWRLFDSMWSAMAWYIVNVTSQRLLETKKLLTHGRHCLRVPYACES